MKADNPSQSAAFIEKAREIDADGKADKADAIMGKLAKTPPDPKHKPKGKKAQ
ncbi:hypothetical protein [Mesorhizobium sp. M0968]|uniref:hypothetical protein n=1 Tax=Mesorhizobium sp. M0968 TaxID=2957037 RepID=UPI00333BAD20